MGTATPADDPELARRLAEAWDLANARGGKDRAQVRAWFFYLLYNRDEGVYGLRKENPYALSRREWIERLLLIVNKETRTVPFSLNRSQRLVESRVLRAERHGRPVRIVILKVRQNGISSYVIAYWLWAILTRANNKAQIITHEEKLYAELLGRLRSMFKRLRQEDGTPWDLPTTSLSRNLIELGDPFHSAVNVVTARADEPGFGQTPTLIDMEETSKWPNAEEKAKGILMGLPMVSGSVAFDISQPNGNTGYFAEKFKAAWARDNQMAEPGRGKVDRTLAQGWSPLFMPWFMHEEYRWTKIGGNPPALPLQLRAQIQQTLTEEEKVLLAQRYYVRGRGLVQVDYDQLAWRRFYVSEVLSGSLDAFHEQCPAFPDEAFLASGRPFFNSEHVRRAMVQFQRPPAVTGTLVKDEGESVFVEDRQGPLWVWKHPEKDRRYAIGVDTAAGVWGGDPCVAMVVDVDSEELMAEWYGWEPPHAFGYAVTLLSDYYEAETAIETQPSQHGLAVFNFAEQYGCSRLFIQQRPDDREHRFQPRKGWIMTAQNKNECMGRVQLALAEEAPIPSKRLLEELLNARIDDHDKMDEACRNDLIVAYGIAQKLADKIRTEQVLPREKEYEPDPGTAEAYWAERRLQEGVPGATPAARSIGTLNGFGL